MGFHDTYRLGVHAVIVDAERRVLQLRRNYGDRSWGLPGGGVDPGETVHAALARECEEELGCAVEIRYLSGVYYHAVYNVHALIFRAELPPGAEVRLSAEHDAFRWFAIDELSAVQRRRVEECLGFDGTVKSAAF
jgi:8-oxo-dGTP pyrophosphatase MutT (NUDIX family)